MQIDLISFNVTGNSTEHKELQKKLTANGINFVAVPIPDFKIPDDPAVLYRIKIMPLGDNPDCTDIIKDFLKLTTV